MDTVPLVAEQQPLGGRERSQSAPAPTLSDKHEEEAIPNSEVPQTDPTAATTTPHQHPQLPTGDSHQSNSRRLSGVFLSLVSRGRAGSLPTDAHGHHVNGGRRGSNLVGGSAGSVITATGSGPYGTNHKSTGMRRNSGSQVNPVDTEVYESLERLIHEQPLDGSTGRLSVGRLSAGSDTPGSRASNLGLPPPPPLKRLDDDTVSKEGEDLTEPSCLICLGKFTQKKPPVQIPCSAKCNLAPVHARCIYEWKEQRSGGSSSPTNAQTGSCPLCRAQLLSLEYVPPDPLATKTLFMHSARRSFVSRPAPKAAGMVRAYIRVIGTGLITSTPVRYEMYLQAPTTRRYPSGPFPPTIGTAEGDQLLMTARRRTTLRTGCSVIDVSLDRQGKDFSKKSPKLLASVRGSLFGLDYTITAPCKFQFHQESKQTLELGSVRFEQNRIGSGAGPRRISVCLPSVRENPEAIDPWPPASSIAKKEAGDDPEEDEEDDEDEAAKQIYETMEYVPQSKQESLRKLVRRSPPVSAAPTSVNPTNGTLPGPPGVSTTEQFIYARNRKPYYLESISAFSLDFFGRVTLPSNKNCLLTCDDSPNASAAPESNILLFGKIGVKGRNADAAVYTLDFQWPLSPLQAFCIALASCDRKFGCA